MRLFFVVLLFISSFVNAQSDSEMGVIGGAAYYLGDINMSRHFYRSSPALGVIYKKNFTDRYALRINALFTELSGRDSDFSNEVQKLRDHSFESKLMDVAAGFEFNFKPFWLPRQAGTYGWTPYVYAGLGYTVAKSDSGLNIPLGAGLKFLLKGNIICGVEWCFRKTFTDKLDYLADPWNAGEKNVIINNDWYSYFGLTLTYRFPADKACDFFDKLFKNI